MSWHCACRPPRWLWLKCACALSEVLVDIPSQLFCWRVHTKGASNGVLSPSSDRHTHDSVFSFFFFFAFSPPEYLWWYPVFNFPPHWPWGIFNAVAQHRLMLHCNSVSVSLCKRRVGFQRGENRWLQLVVLMPGLLPLAEWSDCGGLGGDSGWTVEERWMSNWWMRDWCVDKCGKGGMEGGRQGRREEERGSRGPEAKHSGANLGRAWLSSLLTWLYHLSLYVCLAFSPSLFIIYLFTFSFLS